MLGSILILLSITVADAAGVGVNYGTRATSLPPLGDVARFLARDTIVDRVRLFDADPLALQAFASTGLAVDVTVPNGLVPRLVNLGFAQQWVRANVAPYADATNISRILVGNEPRPGHAEAAHGAGHLVLAPPDQGLHPALPRHPGRVHAAVRRAVPRRLQRRHRQAAPQLPARDRRAVHGERIPVLRPHQRHARLRAVPGERRRHGQRHRAAVHQHAGRAARRRSLGDETARLRRRRRRRSRDRVAVGRGGLGGRRGRGPRGGLQQERHPAPRVRRGHAAHAESHLRGVHLLPLRRESQARSGVREELRPVPRRHDAGLRRRHPHRSGDRRAGEHEGDTGPRLESSGRAAVVRAEAGGGRDGAASEHRLCVRASGHRLRRDTAGRHLLRAGHRASPCGLRHEPLFPVQWTACVRLRLRSDRRRYYRGSQLWKLQIYMK